MKNALWLKTAKSFDFRKLHFSPKNEVFWLSGPNGWPDKKLKHKGNVAHRTFRGGCVIDLVWENDSLYVDIAIFSYKLDTLYDNWLVIIITIIYYWYHKYFFGCF